jgi:hypothetical protein
LGGQPFGDWGSAAAGFNLVIGARFNALQQAIGTDVVTDYDIADDNVRLARGTFFSSIGTQSSPLDARNFAVDSDGDGVYQRANNIFQTTNTGDGLFLYDESNGNLWFTVYTRNGNDAIAQTGVLTSGDNITVNNAQTSGAVQNIILVANFENTPSFNNTNFANEFSVISAV